MADDPSDGLVVNNVMFVETRKKKHVVWTPQEDITAYEVAISMPFLIAMGRDPLNYWEDYIPTEVRRHFTIRD